MQQFASNLYEAGHTGQTDLQNFENAMLTLKSLFSGSSAPSDPADGQFWYDTNNDILKVYKQSAGTWYNFWDYGNNRIADNAVAEASITGLTATFAEINTACDGITATAAEINTACDGVTATAAEINTACDGSTAKNSHTHDMVQMLMFDDAYDADYDSVSDTSWTTYKTWGAYIYVPTGITGIQVRVQAGLDSAQTGTQELRFYCGGVGSSSTGDLGTGWTWYNLNIVGPSTGWQQLLLQLKVSVSAGNFNVRYVSARTYY